MEDWEKRGVTMFGKAFQRKYALTEQGVKNIKKGVWWTVVVDLVVMGELAFFIC